LAIGSPADLVVFDPSARWVVKRETLASVHANTPLLGREVPGAVRLTLADGRITHGEPSHYS
jgi:dihydroorotase